MVEVGINQLVVLNIYPTSNYANKIVYFILMIHKSSIWKDLNI